MVDQKKDHTENTENPQGVGLENQMVDTTEKDTILGEDLEKGVIAIATENPHPQDTDQLADIVGITIDPQVDQDQMVTDQKHIEIMTETRDLTPKKRRERVILAMVDGAEKVARRP